MTADDTLWDLEERFWTQGADSARHATAKGAVFVLPYPAGILQGDALWREKDVAQRWRSVEMSERYLSLQNDIAVLAYCVSAERSDEPIYKALCTSTYLNDDGKLALRPSRRRAPAEPRTSGVTSEVCVYGAAGRDQLHVSRSGKTGSQAKFREVGHRPPRHLFRWVSLCHQRGVRK
jgi:hypothetical protein